MQWLGAVQSQDHGAATWSIAQRLRKLDAAAVHRAFDDGRFVRTHVLRPTWHFVHPADLRWMLALTSPRVLAGNATPFGRIGLDTIRRAERALERELAGGAQRTRAELGVVLGSDGPRLAHVMMHAELTGLVCSGAMRGKQHTYAWLEDRVAPVPALDRDAALRALTLRYFTSHGPSTVKDFRWWSSLTTPDIRHGLEMAGDQLAREVIDGVEHWSGDRRRAPRVPSPTVHLLQAFDELAVGYQGSLAGGGRPPWLHVLSVDGRQAGRWRRTLDGAGARIEVRPTARLAPAVRRALAAEAERHGAFLGVPVTLAITSR